jgi:hypothetical protein
MEGYSNTIRLGSTQDRLDECLHNLRTISLVDSAGQDLFHPYLSLLHTVVTLDDLSKHKVLNGCTKVWPRNMSTDAGIPTVQIVGGAVSKVHPTVQRSAKCQMNAVRTDTHNIAKHQRHALVVYLSSFLAV